MKLSKIDEEFVEQEIEHFMATTTLGDIVAYFNSGIACACAGGIDRTSGKGLCFCALRSVIIDRALVRCGLRRRGKGWQIE